MVKRVKGKLIRSNVVKYRKSEKGTKHKMTSVLEYPNNPFKFISVFLSSSASPRDTIQLGPWGIPPLNGQMFAFGV